tara:strand:- start:10108 stop:10362 length:255 start_codon:yes stop_codon:yes gene_type:complete
MLISFGGTMEINDFRNNNEIFAIYNFPMKSDERIIERYENFSIHQSKNEQSQAVIHNEPIKLKRKTAKISTQNTLETSMGIFKT